MPDRLERCSDCQHDVDSSLLPDKGSFAFWFLGYVFWVTKFRSTGARGKIVNFVVETLTHLVCFTLLASGVGCKFGFIIFPAGEWSAVSWAAFLTEGARAFSRTMS